MLAPLKQQPLADGFSAPDHAPVARIVYASRSLLTGPVYAEMERIRGAAVRNNQPLRVHTALLHQSDWFLQWKEGPPDAVQAIMDRVLRDARHTDLQILHQSEGGRLLPGFWTMAIVQCVDSPDEFARRVYTLRLERESGAEHLPAACWRMLSTPQRHPRAAQQGQADAFQRVLLCSAVADDAFVLVSKLAAMHQAEIVHRRFAGPSALDVGTDYIDIEDGDRVLRLIAMARKGLGLGLTRAFFTDYSHLVLLFSGDPVHDDRLFLRVLQACAGLPVVPILLGVGAAAAANQRMFTEAHQRGLVYLDGNGANPVESQLPAGGRDPAEWLARWPQIAAQLRIARRQAAAENQVG